MQTVTIRPTVEALLGAWIEIGLRTKGGTEDVEVLLEKGESRHVFRASAIGCALLGRFGKREAFALVDKAGDDAELVYFAGGCSIFLQTWRKWLMRNTRKEYQPPRSQNGSQQRDLAADCKLDPQPMFTTSEGAPTLPEGAPF